MKTLIKDNAEHVINFEKKKQSSFRLIYNQFIKKLKALWEYIQKVLNKDWIQKLKSFVNASVLFISKKNSELCLYVNYRNVMHLCKEFYILNDVIFVTNYIFIMQFSTLHKNDINFIRKFMKILRLSSQNLN